MKTFNDSTVGDPRIFVQFLEIPTVKKCLVLGELAAKPELWPHVYKLLT